MLRVEAAHCWMASGYTHETRRVLETLQNATSDWRTQREAELLDLVTQPAEGDDRDAAISSLVLQVS